MYAGWGLSQFMRSMISLSQRLVVLTVVSNAEISEAIMVFLLPGASGRARPERRRLAIRPRPFQRRSIRAPELRSARRHARSAPGTATDAALPRPRFP